MTLNKPCFVPFLLTWQDSAATPFNGAGGSDAGPPVLPTFNQLQSAVVLDPTKQQYVTVGSGFGANIPSYAWTVSTRIKFNSVRHVWHAADKWVKIGSWGW